MENIDIKKVMMVAGAYFIGKKVLGSFVYLALAAGAFYVAVEYKKSGKLPEIPQLPQI